MEGGKMRKFVDSVTWEMSSLHEGKKDKVGESNFRIEMTLTSCDGKGEERCKRKMRRRERTEGSRNGRKIRGKEA